MSEFNVRADSVNVEQIMDQIRARIRDKRGVDYTEDQIRELASVKLEKFLDPRSIRSDLLDQFRKSQPPPAPVTVPLYPFEDTTLFDSHRGIVRLFRRLFRPLLKLFFNSNALAQSLHQQTIINRQTVDRLDALEASVRQRGDLYYELLHNLVLELTRATIEVKNVTMRVESISSRLEFNERRARALESVVVYKTAEPEREARPATPPQAPASPPRGSGGYASRENQRYTPPASPRPQPSAPPPAPSPAPAAPATAKTANDAATPPAGAGDAIIPGEGPGQRSRRRRRRRGRRGGASAAAVMGGASDHAPEGAPASSADAPTDVPHEADARETRAEPFEHTFGSPAHPSAPRQDAPAAPDPPAAEPRSLDAPHSSAEPHPSAEPHSLDAPHSSTEPHSSDAHGDDDDQ